MQTTLAWLGQELQVSAAHLMDNIRLLEDARASEQSHLLDRCDELLASVTGAITVTAQGRSQLHTYAGSLRRLLAKWNSEGKPVDSQEWHTAYLACQALHDYLDVLQSEVAYSELALFPAYASICGLSGDAPHPMQLWAKDIEAGTLEQLNSESVQGLLVASANARLAFVNESDRATHQSQMEGTMLSILRRSDAQANEDRALRAGKILCDLRVCDSQSHEADVAGGSLLLCVFEALASGDLELDIWLKRVLLGSLDWLKRRAECPVNALAFFAYAGWQKQKEQCQDAAQASTLSALTPALSQVATYCAWTETQGSDYNSTALGRLRGEQTAHLLQQLSAAKKALSAWSSESAPKASDRALLDVSLAPLPEALLKFHPGTEPLVYELSSVLGSNAAMQSKAVLIELATTFLTLEAMTGQYLGADKVQLDDRFTELARRLKLTKDGQAPGAIAPWMLSTQQGRAWLETLGQLTQEMRYRVIEIETAFNLENYILVASLARQIEAVAQTINWKVFAQAAASVHIRAQTLVSLPESDFLTSKEHLTHNLAAMGLFVEMQAQNGSGSVDLFSFDMDTERLIMLGHSPAQLDERSLGTLMPTAHEFDTEMSDEGLSSELDESLVALFHDEAKDVLLQAHSACTALESSPWDLEQIVSLRRAFHTLKGSARMAGLMEFGEQAWQTEQCLNLLLSEKMPATSALLQDIRQAMHTLGAQLPSSQPLSVQSIEQPTDWLDLPDTSDLPATKTIGDITISLTLYNAYLNEADEWSRQLASALSEWAVDDAQPLPIQTLTWAHALAGSSATVGFLQLAVLAKTIEQLLERVEQDHFSHPELALQLARGADDIRRLLHQFAAGFLKEPELALLTRLQWLIKQPCEVILPQPQPQPASARAAKSDETSLTAIFEEEAAVLMPDLGMALRFWLQSAERTDQSEQRAQTLRVLHTLKGSARLVGELQLADKAHLLESSIESYAHAPSPEQSAALLAQYDAMHVNEPSDSDTVIQSDDSLASVPSALEELLDSAQPATLVANPSVPRPVSPAASLSSVSFAATGDVMRVKLGLIDRLINQSGEILIARARMEAETQRSQHTLGDMGLQVARLREQLRELELQTESQMQSRQAQVSDQAQVFDPLEFDRFTRTQELTRFMAEALGDISTLQRSLLRGLNATEDDLAAQSRQARDLQRNLLQTRMVSFESIAERLHRLVRVTSQELGKSAELSIHGGLQEIDRSVLERVVPAFEHLLRNAIVHGIEPSAERLAAGKASAGQIRIDLTQNGNDVLVTVQDDGRGLDVAAVRAKAAHLNPATAPLVDSADPVQLIFMSGLSTASVVSELAGRGIGMDVVRAQVLALGGRIEVETQPGVGTAFRLVLPLTTAVTQIVLVRTGTLMTALPANLVQTIVRAKPEQLDQAQTSGKWASSTSHCAFYTLGHLLQHQERGTAVASPAVAAQVPLQSVIMLSSSNQSVALLVDEVLGNQEVVVKNLGPQLSQMPGLAGMTVLPTGETVLIYNPVALATVYGARLKAAQTAQSMASAKLDDPEASLSNDGIFGVALAPLVLAVDDSITMRRVLQRLLLREGYRVLQAADGKQALELLRVEIPALILSDVEMPRMDGFELLKQIRSSERMRDIPVVMITSRIADKHREHAKSLGANEYLGKPYPEEELIELLHRYAPL
jgi:chemosensory pili system protein ChpA (sensor histidine kinase/response regulator)